MSHKKKTDFFAPYNFITERSVGINSATQNNLISHRFRRAKNLYRRDLRAHFGCVNAIEFSHGNGDWIVSGGDDRRVLLWNVQKAIDTFGKPSCMKGEHHSNIFCLAFDTNNKKVFSGGNDEQVIVHDATTGETVDVFLHEDAVYGLSIDPVNDNVFASACDDGRVLIYDLRAPSDEDPFCLANYTSPMHAVMFNPVEPRLVATANSREGLGLWDVRKPRTCLIRYGGSLSQQSCMSVRINSTGDRVIGLRRRLPPVLYNLHSTQTLYQFDHSGYYNSCTMKSCCFAGDKDQYIISGSDDFNLYIWKIPDEGCSDWVGEAHLVLRGHRSIVNQVRFNPSNHLIISSGVEKVVKMWSPFPLVEGSGDLGLCPDTDERSVYTHEQYINLVLRTGQFMTHDYSNESTEEDPRMMAFFDSLVQRELEGWSSEDSFSSHSPIHDNYVHSDTSLRSSPNVTAEEVQSIATDAILRFFSPSNAITNRNSGPAEVTDAHQDSQAENSASNVRNNNSNPELRTILDMDHNVPSVVSLASSNPSSSSTNSLTNVENGYTPDESQHEYSRKRSINTRESSRTESEIIETQPSVSQDDTTERQSSGQQEENSATESNTNRDEPSTSHASDVAHDITNRAASYKSISELIQQKRKDYISSIKKLEKRAIRRKMRYLARRKEKLKRIRLRLLPSMGDDKLSDSDSDELNDEDVDDFKEAQFSSDGSTSSDSDSQTASNSKEEASSSTSFSSPSSSGQAVVNEIVEKRQQLLNRVQKFKKLKKRVLNSDSSDSDSHQENKIPEFTKENNSKNGQSKNGTDIPVPVYEDISNDSCPVNVVNGQSENLRLDFSNIVTTCDAFLSNRCNHSDDQVKKCDTSNGANNKYSANCPSHDTKLCETAISNDNLNVGNESSTNSNNVKLLGVNESNISINTDQLNVGNDSNALTNDTMHNEQDKKCNGRNTLNSNGTLICSQLNQNIDNEMVTNGTVSEVNSSTVNRSDLNQEFDQNKGCKETTTAFKKFKSNASSGKRNYRRRDSNDNGD